MRLPISEYTNRHPISHHFPVIKQYLANYRLLHGVPLFNALVLYEHVP